LRSAAELGALQIEALCDDPGRATLWCHVMLVRTAEQNIWRTSASLPEPLAAQAVALLAEEPVVSDFSAEPRCAAALRRLLQRHVELASEYRGPAFALPEYPPEDDPEVEIDFAKLEARLRLASGHSASICESAAKSDHVVEAGLNTDASYRGLGYGPRVVRGWAQAVRRSNRLPLYSTSWDNSASRRVAQKLGAQCYGENFHLDPPRVPPNS
jgi:RimJ/RimL family protein N-acetyltransferase